MIPFNHLGPLFKYFSADIYSTPVREALACMLDDLAADSPVLDLGAGTGTLAALAHAKRSDLRFTALDPAEGMLKYTPHYVTRTLGVAEAIPFANESFRAVLIGEALHHFTDTRTAFREIARVLQADGALFIFEFDPTTFFGGMICRTERLLGEPGNFFPPDTLCHILEKLGFSATYARFDWRYVIQATRRE